MKKRETWYKCAPLLWQPRFKTCDVFCVLCLPVCRFSAPEELHSIIQEVKYRSGLQSAKLIRQLRRRDRLCHKLQKNYDIITACLQAVSQKRRKNTHSSRFCFDARWCHLKGFNSRVLTSSQRRRFMCHGYICGRRFSSSFSNWNETATTRPVHTVCRSQTKLNAFFIYCFNPE